jgi:hypothetical protein
MNKNTPNQNKFQFEIELPTETTVRIKSDEITCHDCRKPSELGGYRFALVPVCDCCRVEREVQITGNRFERRMKR